MNASGREGWDGNGSNIRRPKKTGERELLQLEYIELSSDLKLECLLLEMCLNVNRRRCDDKRKTLTWFHKTRS